MKAQKEELMLQNKKIDNFVTELKELLNHHGFTILEDEQTNSRGIYTHSDYHFVIDGKVHWYRHIEEILKEKGFL